MATCNVTFDSAVNLQNRHTVLCLLITINMYFIFSYIKKFCTDIKEDYIINMLASLTYKRVFLVTMGILLNVCQQKYIFVVVVQSAQLCPTLAIRLQCARLPCPSLCNS